MLQSINSPSVELKAIDQVPKCVSNSNYDNLLSKSQSQTSGLAFQLFIKIGARVILTSNIDVSDKLINGQMGTVIFIEWENSKVKTVYVNFDNVNAGKNKKLLDPLTCTQT